MDQSFFEKRYAALGGSITKVKLSKSIRVNTLKISKEQLAARLSAKGVKLEQIPFLKNGYYADSPFSLGSTPEYLLGLYQLQEAASQLPAEVLAPTDKDCVLDMCASPGSKTTQLSQLMDNKGLLIALELKKERLPSLCNNLERMGAKNAIVYHLNGLYASVLKLKFTKILLDVPCSGNYAAEPGWFAKRTLEGIRRNAGLQKQLLTAAAGLVADKGQIVYSTCSLEPEENEENIRWACKHLHLKLDPIEGPGSSVLEGTRRFWPGQTQGFFIARLRK